MKGALPNSVTMPRWLIVCLAALVGTAVAIQVWLLPHRWINPDEGAHLMDARLAMEGLVPEIQFESRQPLYVYAYVPFLRLLGAHYVGGRVMPLVATWLASLLLYLLGRRLWDRTVGAWAAVLYLVAPSIFMNAGVVKTEPLAIVLTCLGMHGAVVHLHSGRWRPLFLSGVAFGLGYYVRESTLAGLLAVMLLCLLRWREGLGRWLQRVGLLACGYGAVVSVVLVCYARYVPLAQLFSNASLFPLAKIAGSLGHIFGWQGGHVSASSVSQAIPQAASQTLRHSAQSWSTTVRNLMNAVHLNLYFLMGAIIAGGFWCWSSWIQRAQRSQDRQRDSLGLAVAFSWLGCMALLYSYQILERGFFQFYIREFIPPLALLLAFVFGRVIPQSIRGTSIRGVASAAGSRARRLIVGFAMVTSLAISGAVTVTYAMKVLGPAYDCVWSPETLKRVVRLIEDHSAPQDEVLSGAVIWEFESGRQPFMRVSHPLRFTYVMPDQIARDLLQRFELEPPKLIVLDGYTQQTYLRQLHPLEGMITTGYDLVGEVDGSKYPVKIYALRPRSIATR